MAVILESLNLSLSDVFCNLYNTIVECNVVASETLYWCRSKFKNLRKAIVFFLDQSMIFKNCTRESLYKSVTNTFFD